MRVPVALALVALIWLLAPLRLYAADLTIPWDAKNQFYAFYRFLAAELHNGGSPFWNPYHYGGHPGIADPQSLIFAPLFLAWAWIDPAPSMRIFDCLVLLHLLIGGLAIVGIGRRRDWPVAAVVLAATVFMFGGAASGRVNHVGIIVAYGLFPLALLLLEVALERRSLVVAGLFGVVAAMIVLGRNQVALLLCLLLAILAVATIIRTRRPIAYLWERLGVITVMALVVAALSAIPVLLTLEMAALSNRPAVTLADALKASVHPAAFLTAIAPNAFGSHLADFSYWGPGQHTVPEVSETDESFTYLFVGVVPLTLLFWFGLASGRLAQPGLRTWTLVLAGAVLFSLGRYAPVFPWVFEHLPGFAYFRRPVDGLFVVCLMIALITGQMLADFARQERAGLSTSRAGLAAAVVIVLAVVAAGFQIAVFASHARETAFELARGVGLCGLVAALLWVARTAPARARVATALTAIAVGELVVWNTGSRFAGERSAYYQVLEAPAGDERDALEVLTAELRRRHAEGSRPRVEVLGLGGACQNLAIVQGIEATNGYNPLRIGVYDRYVNPGETAAFTQNRRFNGTFRSYDCALAVTLGLEYLVLDRPIAELSQLPRIPRHEVLRDGPRVWIYRFAPGLPRVKFHSRVEIADADRLVASGDLANPPNADRVLLDDDTPVAPRFRFARGGPWLGAARIVDWRPDRVEIAVDAPSSGFVVLHDTYYPGWVAEVDGREVAIVRADTLFRGVEVEAGARRIVFRYEPLGSRNLMRIATDLLRRPRPPTAP